MVLDDVHPGGYKQWTGSRSRRPPAAPPPYWGGLKPGGGIPGGGMPTRKEIGGFGTGAEHGSPASP